MNLYRYALNNIPDAPSFEIRVAAGSKVFTLSFTWASPTQESYDELMMYFQTLSSSDPLTNGKEYIRDYDWISYYKALNEKSLEGLKEWYNTQEFLPVSIRNAGGISYISILQEKISRAVEYDTQRNIKEESLRWLVKVSVDNEIIVTFLQPGGWNDFNTGHAFRFICEGRDVVSYEDIKYVQVEFDIDE